MIMLLDELRAALEQKLRRAALNRDERLSQVTIRPLSVIASSVLFSGS
jgi:hypothetical protein